MTVTGTDMVVLALYAAPLMVAALWDVATYRIPNFLNLVFLGLFPVATLLAPQPVDWLAHLAAGGLVLAVGFALFSLRLLGGGDVKLLAVAALWLGWSRLLEFSLLVCVLGGALAVLLLVLRTPPIAILAAHFRQAPKLLQTGAPVPYGIAIAAGGLLLATRLPLLSTALDTLGR